MLLAGALAVQTRGNAYPVLQAGQNVLEVLLHCLGAAWQVDDQGLAAQHADAAARHPPPGGAPAAAW